MVHTEISGDKLIIKMSGWDILWSCKTTVEVPLSHITRVRADHHPSFPAGKFVWRMGGTYLPGVITAGSYLCDKKWYFWHVRNGVDAVVIELQGQHYTELVIDVPNPDQFVKKLRTEIATGAVEGPFLQHVWHGRRNQTPNTGKLRHVG